MICARTSEEYIRLVDEVLPFKHLLNVINTTYRKGLDVDE